MQFPLDLLINVAAESIRQSGDAIAVKYIENDDKGNGVVSNVRISFPWSVR
jgi:hypothetical protein